MKRLVLFVTVLFWVSRLLAADVVLGPRLPTETDDSPRLNRLYQIAAAGDTIVIPSGEYTRRSPIVWKGDKPVHVKAWGAHIRVPDNVIPMPTIIYGGMDGKAWFDVEFIGPHITGNNAGTGIILSNLARARVRTGLIRACTDGVVLHAGGGVGMNTLRLDLHCISGCQSSLRVECDAASCINNVKFDQFTSQTWGDAPMVFSIPDGANCSGWLFSFYRIENNGSLKPNMGRFVGGPFLFAEGGDWVEADNNAVWQIKALPSTSVKFKGRYFPRTWHGGGVVE